MSRPADELLTVLEAADVAGISEHALRRRIATGRLRARKLSPKAVRVRRADAETLAREEGLLTARDVARRARVCVETVWRWSRAGRLPNVRLGRGVRFREAQVAAFLAG